MWEWRVRIYNTSKVFNNFPLGMKSVQFCLLNIELTPLWSPTFVFGWIWSLKNEMPQHHVSQLKKTKMEGQFHFLNLKDLNQTYLKFKRQKIIIYHLKYYSDYKIITKKISIVNYFVIILTMCVTQYKCYKLCNVLMSCNSL